MDVEKFYPIPPRKRSYDEVFESLQSAVGDAFKRRSAEDTVHAMRERE